MLICLYVQCLHLSPIISLCNPELAVNIIVQRLAMITQHRAKKNLPILSAGCLLLCAKFTSTLYLQLTEHFHMIEQLLARSLRISVSLNSSVRPGSCDTRFSPLLELLRLRFLWMRLTEAKVVT